MPTIRPELCLQPDTVKTSNWSCIANADREILGLSSESVESEPGLANAKRREAPVLAREPKETAAIFEKHRKKSSSISPKHQPSTLALVGNGGGLFLFRVCRDFVRGDVERRGQRAVRADGTRPIKSQRFLFHQRRRIEASDQLARKG